VLRIEEFPCVTRVTAERRRFDDRVGLLAGAFSERFVDICGERV